MGFVGRILITCLTISAPFAMANAGVFMCEHAFIGLGAPAGRPAFESPDVVALARRFYDHPSSKPYYDYIRVYDRLVTEMGPAYERTLAHYTSQSYRSMNQFMRENNPDFSRTKPVRPPGSELDPPHGHTIPEGWTHQGWTKWCAFHLVKILNVSPKVPVGFVLHRGMGLATAEVPKVGDALTDRGFLSTAVQPATARFFAERVARKMPRGQRVHIIMTNKSKNLRAGPGNSNENEMLLPPNTKVIVTRVESFPEADFHIVHADILD